MVFIRSYLLFVCGSRPLGRLRLDKGSHRGDIHGSFDLEGPGERTLTNCLFKAVRVVVHMGSAAAEAALRVRNQAVLGTLDALNDDAQQL